MKIKVKAFGDLKRLLDNETIIEIEDDSGLEDLFSKLAIMTRTYKKGFIGSHKVGSDLTVLINGRNMNVLEAPSPLRDGDTVELLPFSVGG